MAWIKLDDGFLDHPKFLAAGPLAGYLHITAIAWCNQNLTDGILPRAQPARLVAWHTANDDFNPEVVGKIDPCDEAISWGMLVHRLVEARLWEELPDGDYRVHDYLEWQSSSEQILAKRRRLSSARSEAGKRGAAERWNSKGDGKSVARGMANPRQQGKQTNGKEVRSKKESSYELSSSGKELCALLAELVIANGRPKHLVDPKAQGWQDAARLMLDRDERDPDEAKRLIRWCQADEFWRSNILSMPKFREQYDRLRLRAVKDNGHVPSPSHHADEVEATRRRLEEAEV